MVSETGNRKQALDPLPGRDGGVALPHVPLHESILFRDPFMRRAAEEHSDRVRRDIRDWPAEARKRRR